jgi:hypothetical protein
MVRSCVVTDTSKIMNLLKFSIVAIPSLFMSFIVIDFVYTLYRTIDPSPGAILRRNPRIREAAELYDRLVKVEHVAFQSYLKAPDVETLQSQRDRLVQIRTIAQRADLRFKRRVLKFAVA